MIGLIIVVMMTLDSLNRYCEFMRRLVGVFRMVFS